MTQEDHSLLNNENPSKDSEELREERAADNTKPPAEAPRTYRRLLPDLITISRALPTKKRHKTDDQKG
ncbi:hypothetical protein IHN32_00725 [Deinococcus sp. 14RED07]|uniref:hypothetical protein n=1 Tax=unclassified Deinococcus TaxID=2623546 RepID=UPI001E4F5804|nr:hypothetical protein [Deinococcus sp. 14RED07]MCD0174480.1 hypothetical protein [Deinococcus sp. 14RED07]